MTLTPADRVRLSRILQNLRLSSNATFFYDIMSDALVWTDETPPLGGSYTVHHTWYLRPVFRYRSSLIEGIPDSRFEPAWIEALSLFPTWIGFLTDRRSSSHAAALQSMRTAANKEMKDIEAAFDPGGPS